MDSLRYDCVVVTVRTALQKYHAASMYADPIIVCLGLQTARASYLLSCLRSHHFTAVGDCVNVYVMSAQESKTWLGYHEPEDTASIKRISVQEVADMIKNTGSSDRKFQLVDVRRSDLTVSSCSSVSFKTAMANASALWVSFSGIFCLALHDSYLRAT